MELGRQPDEEAGPCKRCSHILSMHYEAMRANEEGRRNLPSELVDCITGTTEDGNPKWFLPDENYVMPPEAAERQKFLKEHTLNLGDVIP